MSCLSQPTALLAPPAHPRRCACTLLRTHLSLASPRRSSPAVPSLTPLVSLRSLSSAHPNGSLRPAPSSLARLKLPARPPRPIHSPACTPRRVSCYHCPPANLACTARIRMPASTTVLALTLSLPAAPPAPGRPLAHATRVAALALARPASPLTPLYLLSRPRPAALALACSCSRESACAASLTLRGPSSTPRLPALPHSRQPLPPAPSRRPWDHRQAPAGLLEEYLVGLFSTNSSSRQRQAGLCQRQSHPQARSRGHEVQSLP